MMIPGTEWPLFETFTNNTKLMQGLLKVPASTLAPSPEHVFDALKLVTPAKTKVIIIGQDPYINGEAHGLSFSSKKGMTPTLNIMFKELEREGFHQKSTDLTRWAEQGVLLLNTILTTKLGESLAHSDLGWQQFTKAVVRYVVNLGQPLVIMLWGGNAKRFWEDIKKTLPDEEGRAGMLILSSVHPVAESRGSGKFTGNNHFAMANDWLTSWDIEPIKWEDDD